MIGHPLKSGACITFPQLTANVDIYIFDARAEHESHTVCYVFGQGIP